MVKTYQETVPASYVNKLATFAYASHDYFCMETCAYTHTRTCTHAHTASLLARMTAGSGTQSPPPLPEVQPPLWPDQLLNTTNQVSSLPPGRMPCEGLPSLRMEPGLSLTSWTPCPAALHPRTLLSPSPTSGGRAPTHPAKAATSPQLSSHLCFHYSTSALYSLCFFNHHLPPLEYKHCNREEGACPPVHQGRHSINLCCTNGPIPLKVR